MARDAIVLELDEELIWALRELAERSQRSEDDIVADALRQYVAAAGRVRALHDLFDGLAGSSDLDDEAVMELAYAELRESRRQRNGE